MNVAAARKIDLFQAIIDAWKAKDIDGVLARMDDDIVWHYAAAVEPPIRGKAQARKFLTRFGGGIAEIRWRVFDHAERGDRLFVEGVDEYITNEGRTVAAAYAGVIEFKGDLVVGWRDYVDVGVMAAQIAGGPISNAVKSLIDREVLV